ncbi:hypothetical protein RB195_013017 [Necator americanus]|uniref:TIL domain-containing protein n=1 Tax=Necator americanus TaxID=51031 RepID=A0ABR1DTQ1_NECAM
MVKPQNCVKGKPCKLFPRCIPREQSCLSTPSKPSCSPGNRCELHDVTCVKAPCWPAKVCLPVKCPPHEKWHDCGTCQPICGQPIPSCLHYVLPAGSYTATTKEPHCKHASCAECKNYSNDCVCEMVMPQYCIEGKPCKLFTRCIPREQSCLLSPCFPGFRCELADITCEKAPCWPTKRCAPAKCPPNEEWNDCGTCQPICGQPIPFCPAICGRAGCQCIEGFSRNDSVCVPSSSCS